MPDYTDEVNFERVQLWDLSPGLSGFDEVSVSDGNGNITITSSPYVPSGYMYYISRHNTVITNGADGIVEYTGDLPFIKYWAASEYKSVSNNDCNDLEMEDSPERGLP